MMNNNSIFTLSQREAFFTSLYEKAFYAFASFVARRGGSIEETQDIFQDALVIYYEKSVSGLKVPVVDEKAYVIGIAKNLWLQHCRTVSRYLSIGAFEIEIQNEEVLLSQKLLRYLGTAGRKCMELLKASYYDHLPVAEIATRFGYSSNRSATVAKYKCLEKVRETVKQNAIGYADFIE